MGLMRWFQKMRDQADRLNLLHRAIQLLQRAIQHGEVHYLRGWDGESPHIEVRGSGWIFFPLSHNPNDNVGLVPQKIKDIFSGGAEDIFLVFPAAISHFPRNTRVVGRRVVEAKTWWGDPNGNIARGKTNLGQQAQRNVLFIIE